jgi:hypothetical protein
MTIQDVTNNVTYSGDGVTTSFPFVFRVGDITWVNVNFTNDISSINLNIDQDANPGGSIEYSVAPPSGQDITILRITPVTQETNYGRYDPFDSETNEDNLDKIVSMIQDLSTDLGDIVTQVANFEWQFVSFSGDYTPGFTDKFKMLRSVDDGGTQTVTIPPNADVPFEVGTQISFKQHGTSILDFVPGVGVTLDSPNSFEVSGQYGSVTVVQDEPNRWFLVGNLKP